MVPTLCKAEKIIKMLVIMCQNRCYASLKLYGEYVIKK